MNTQSLNAKLINVRSYFATPHQKLIEKRSESTQAHRETYERASDLGSEAEGLIRAGQTVDVLAKLIANGKLAELTQMAQEQAVAQAGNPFGFLGLRTRQGLSEVLGGEQSQEQTNEWSLAGAVVLAGALSQENPTGALAQTVAHEYSIKGNLPELSGVGLSDLSGWSAGLQDLGSKMAEEARKVDQQARQQWDAVSDVQSQLDAHWKSRNKDYGARVAAAQEFLTELDQAQIENPTVLKEMRNQLPAEFKAWLPNNILDSYRAQLKRTGGDASKVDWGKMLKQLERTSFD
jgi:hypothetical protein